MSSHQEPKRGTGSILTHSKLSSQLLRAPLLLNFIYHYILHSLKSSLVYSTRNLVLDATAGTRQGRKLISFFRQIDMHKTKHMTLLRNKDCSFVFKNYAGFITAPKKGGGDGQNLVQPSVTTSTSKLWLIYEVTHESRILTRQV